MIRIFNPDAERMWGYPAAEVIDKLTPADLSDPQEVFDRAGALRFANPIAPAFEALAFKAAARRRRLIAEPALVNSGSSSRRRRRSRR